MTRVPVRRVGPDPVETPVVHREVDSQSRRVLRVFPPSRVVVVYSPLPDNQVKLPGGE